MLRIGTWCHTTSVLVTHTCTDCPGLSVMDRYGWGEVGDAEGTMPSGKCFSLGRAECLSVSRAWSFIIYRRDKIKQTQQNGVKSERGGSHIHTLWLRREESCRCTRSRVCPTPCFCLPASLSEQQSGGKH